ncbi:MAG: hypothetical protein IJU31_06645, partial [Synergistaceae bacterium]|nr:hypothetical protein [Synergistaceae bacterium]
TPAPSPLTPEDVATLEEDSPTVAVVEEVEEEIPENEISVETEVEPETNEPEIPEVTEPEEEEEEESLLTPTSSLLTPEEPEPFVLKYDVTSGERYVDKVSTKTEFDKMLDELAAISKDLLSWEVEKFAKKYTGKFQGEFEKTEADAKKYEAFLGGYITNAAMTLYDNGYREAAIKQLEQAQNILVARKKLEDETQAIKDRVEEEDAAVDLSDILGMFGDG